MPKMRKYFTKKKKKTKNINPAEHNESDDNITISEYNNDNDKIPLETKTS